MNSSFESLGRATDAATKTLKDGIYEVQINDKNEKENNDEGARTNVKMSLIGVSVTQDVFYPKNLPHFHFLDIFKSSDPGIRDRC